jgi:uncharacterized protein YodC (DUF2158 family)
MEIEEELVVGDVVQLKSGGPKMTVIDAGEALTALATCQWFTDAQLLCEERFPYSALVKCRPTSSITSFLRGSD